MLLGFIVRGRIRHQNDENNERSLKYNDTILKLLHTSLKLKSIFVQGHFSGRNWIVLWMKMNENSLKNSGKPI